ncbi:hypothetical protein [Bulleidia sp. HCP3S3_F2]|uniref:hypothetical protein n=1 Tax=unclassified Bulleidia TaxID=2704656 RepID=UPI003F8B3868
MGIKPREIWNNCKEDFTNEVIGFATSIGDNPNTVGKNSNIGDLAYMTVMLQKKV